MSSAIASRTADIHKLVDDLGGSLRRTSKARFEKIRQNAAAAARTTTHPRTNQFAVRDQIFGLQEKAEILHRSDLAAELAAAVGRADALQNKWMPELLSLLLQTSDRPIDKTDLVDLQALRKPDSEKQLTWDDILRDDPLDDDGVWDDVDFAATSSDDGDDFSFVHSETSVTSTAEVEVDPSQALQAASVDTKLDLLDDVVEWRNTLAAYDKADEAMTVFPAETEILQTSLSMLQGLPNDLFTCTHRHWIARPRIDLGGSSCEVLYSVLNQCAALGNQITKLRGWAQRHSSSPIEQTFLMHLRGALHRFDHQTCILEQRILDPSNGAPNTLIGFMPEIRKAFRELSTFSRVLKYHENPDTESFVYLDFLYEELIRQQSLGDRDGFAATLAVFDDMLQTFLKPIKEWLRYGKIDPSMSFLTQLDKSSTNHASFWSNSYEVNVDADGAPIAPKFFHPFVKKILSVGKTTIFLRLLGETLAPLPVHEARHSVFARPLVDDSLSVPFSETLREFMSDWIAAKSQPSSERLSSILQTKGGLNQALAALEYLYFGRNSVCLDDIAIRLMDRIGQGMGSSTSSHALTVIYQDAFSLSSHVNAGLITVRRSEPSQRGPYTFVPIDVLQHFSVFYPLTWPIANVLTPESLWDYRSIHLLLIKVRIAKLTLDHRLWASRHDVRRDPTRSRTLFLRLRHRLTWFTNIISSYILGIVLPDVHHQLQLVAGFVGDIDDLIELHKRIVHTALKRCVLNWDESAAPRALESILALVMAFAFQRFDVAQDAVENQHRDEETLAEETSNPASRSEHIPESQLEVFLGTYSRLHGLFLAGVLEKSRSEGDRQLQMLAHNIFPDSSWTDNSH